MLCSHSILPLCRRCRRAHCILSANPSQRDAEAAQLTVVQLTMNHDERQREKDRALLMYTSLPREEQEERKKNCARFQSVDV